MSYRLDCLEYTIPKNLVMRESIIEACWRFGSRFCIVIDDLCACYTLNLAPTVFTAPASSDAPYNDLCLLLSLGHLVQSSEETTNENDVGQAGHVEGSSIRKVGSILRSVNRLILIFSDKIRQSFVLRFCT